MKGLEINDGQDRVRPECDEFEIVSESNTHLEL